MADKSKEALWLCKIKSNCYDPNEQVGKPTLSHRMIDGMVWVFSDAMRMNTMAFVMVELPGQPKPEIILNYPDSLYNKLSYYREAYNDDGTLKSNPEIKIIGMGTVPLGFEMDWRDFFEAYI